MLTTYRRGWSKVYPVIQPPRRASQQTRCVGNRTTRTNRRLGGLSTRGGFGRLGRTLHLFGGHVSHTGLAHRRDHLRARLGIEPNTPGRWKKSKRSYRLSERGMTRWSSVCNSSTPWSSACDSSRSSCPPWEYHNHVLVLSLHMHVGSTSSVSSASVGMIYIVYRTKLFQFVFITPLILQVILYTLIVYIICR
jgi:hypothetical protein